jgi:hypothetical protein
MPFSSFGLSSDHILLIQSIFESITIPAFEVDRYFARDARAHCFPDKASMSFIIIMEANLNFASNLLYGFICSSNVAFPVSFIDLLSTTASLYSLV